MQTFNPPQAPEEAPDWFKRWAREHAAAVKKAANDANDSVPARYLPAAPTRPKDGAIILADGSNFDPGSGKGAYRVSVSGSTVTYTFLG